MTYPRSIWPLLALAGCISVEPAKSPPDAIRIGTVLPFTGEQAASGTALEAAMRLAIGAINDYGGLGGRPLWLDVRNSHSDDDRGTANALALIDESQPAFFIGTEEPVIAYRLTSAIKSHGMVHLMPGLTSMRFHDPSGQAAWLRLSPEVRYIACSLAKHMLADGITKASVVIDQDDYSGSFATNFDRVFAVNGGTVLPNLQVGSTQTSFDDIFSTLSRLDPDAVGLVTSPIVAARILQEWAVRGHLVKTWYLGPTLNNPQLLRNVPTGMLEGVEGISADLGEDATSFEAYFQAATGMPPLAGSHYYFDAVAMLALAVQEAIAQTREFPTPASVKAHITQVTKPGGTVVSFRELPKGLALVTAGEKVEYHGAAGVYVLDALGDNTQNRGTVWKISGMGFENTESHQCLPSEVASGSGGT